MINFYVSTFSSVTKSNQKAILVVILLEKSNGSQAGTQAYVLRFQVRFCYHWACESFSGVPRNFQELEIFLNFSRNSPHFSNQRFSWNFYLFGNLVCLQIFKMAVSVSWAETLAYMVKYHRVVNKWRLLFGSKREFWN